MLLSISVTAVYTLFMVTEEKKKKKTTVVYDWYGIIEFRYLPEVKMICITKLSIFLAKNLESRQPALI